MTLMNGLVTRYKEILRRCNIGYILENMVKPKMLMADLERLREMLKTRYVQLVIPPEQILKYYKLRIAKCHINNDKIQVAVRVLTNDKPQDSVYHI
jgi:hypothetical protein